MRKLATIVALAFVLAPTTLASAQAVQDTYRGQSESLGVIGEIEEVTPAPTPTPTDEEAPPPPAPPTPAPTPEGGLPFTGFEAMLVALGGLALVGGGFALRRASRPPADPVA